MILQFIEIEYVWQWKILILNLFKSIIGFFQKYNFSGTLFFPGKFFLTFYYTIENF